MEEIEKINTEISEDICDIEVDFYGNKLAVGVSSGKIYLFDNKNGKTTKTSEVNAHIGPVLKVAWSHPSFGPILASGGFDKKVNLFRIDYNNQFEKIYEHELHENCVQALKFSKSSNNFLLISGCLNGNLISCEYVDKNIVTNKTIAHDFGINAIDFFDDKTFVTCGNDNLIKIWTYNQEKNIQNDFVLKDVDYITKDVSCKDNKHFVSCGEDGVAYYWIFNDEQKKWVPNKIFSSPENNKLEKIRFNEEFTSIAILDENGKEYLITENELKFENS